MGWAMLKVQYGAEFMVFLIARLSSLQGSIIFPEVSLKPFSGVEILYIITHRKLNVKIVLGPA